MNDKFYWFDYPSFYQWIAKDPMIKIVAEVGSWKGHSVCYLAEEMLKNNKVFKIYCVDVWEKWEYYTTFDETQKELLEDVRKSHDIFDDNVRKHGVRDFIVDIQDNSHNGSKRFDDKFFDCVFLDADHQYDVVLKDIELWYPKVKKGGIISGHDYFELSCGVKKAVDEKFKNVKFMGSIWYTIKKE